MNFTQPFTNYTVHSSKQTDGFLQMKSKQSILFFVLSGMMFLGMAQENEDYIEFNDRKTVVHGVYTGINLYYGEIDGKNTCSFEGQVAYVANRKLILGLGWTSFYSNQNFTQFDFSDDIDFAGGYGGFHIEPIFFSKKRVNLSLPVLTGIGYVGYLDEIFDRNETNELLINKHNDLVFVIEPGVNLLFNISRYVQLEAGVRYRISDKIKLAPNYITNINSFSAGLGIRVGVFNMGKNRYKKNLQ